MLVHVSRSVRFVLCVTALMLLMMGCMAGITGAESNPASIEGVGEDGDDGDDGGNDGGAGDGGGGAGDGGGVAQTRTLAMAGLADILQSLIASNANGILLGTMGAVTLPPCTQQDGSTVDFDVTYALGGLPAGVSFDGTARQITGTVARAEANAVQEVTYVCTAVAEPTLVAQRTFSLNDYDADTIPDDYEYRYSNVPYVGHKGSIVMDPVTAWLFVGSSTGISVTAQTLAFDDAADAALDYDGDGATNAAEFAAGSDLYIAASGGIFVGALDHDTGINYPAQKATGDFDNDGNIDIATLYAGIDTLSILLGDGTGSFLQTNYATGRGAGDVAVVDADADGNDDVVVTNMTDNTMYFYRGLGDGTLTAFASYGTGATPQSIDTGDLDNDGRVDIVVANRDDDTGSVFLGNGDGTFQTRRDFALGDAFDLRLADFNNDGRLDIAAFSSDPADDTLTIFTGDGDGTFTLLAQYTGGRNPYEMGVADINNDGFLDIATSSWSPRNVAIWLNNGDGTMAAPLETNPGATLHLGIALGDLDGDGNVDYVLDESGPDRIRVYYGNGDGTFVQSAVSIASYGRYGTIADFDSDGMLDYTVTVLFSTRLPVYLQ